MEKQENLKNQILDIAWNILSLKGQDAVQLRILAQRTHCSVGMIYNLFNNLEDILFHLKVRGLKVMYSQLHEAMHTSIQNKAPLKTTCFNIGIRYISFACENTFIWKSLFENTTPHYPDWYQSAINEGKLLIKNTLKNTYQIDQEKIDQIMNFSWIAIHGLSGVILNKKLHNTQISHEYIEEYINYALSIVN